MMRTEVLTDVAAYGLHVCSMPSGTQLLHTLLSGLAAPKGGLPAFSEVAGEGRKGNSCSLPKLPLVHRLSVEDDTDKRPGLLAERSSLSSTLRASLKRRESGLGLIPFCEQLFNPTFTDAQGFAIKTKTGKWVSPVSPTHCQRMTEEEIFLA